MQELASELELQRSQFEVQVAELESKVDTQNKIIAMLKLRLHEEHKARFVSKQIILSPLFGVATTVFIVQILDVVISKP